MNNKNTNNKLGHLTIDNIQNCYIPLVNNEEETKLHMIQEEFRTGIDTVKNLEASVTFYGGARFKEDDEVYKKVQKLAYRISKELGYTIITGGGGGVMEAASRGAYEAGGKALGLTIKLPHEQKVNKYITQ